MKIEIVREKEDDDDPYEVIMADAREALASYYGEFAIETTRGWEPNYNIYARYLVGLYLNRFKLDSCLVEDLTNRVEVAVPAIIESVLSRSLYKKQIQNLDWKKLEKLLPDDIKSFKTFQRPRIKWQNFWEEEVWNRVLFLLECGIDTVKIAYLSADSRSPIILDECMFRKVILSKLLLNKSSLVQRECSYLMEFNDLVPVCMKLLGDKYGLKTKMIGKLKT